MNAQLNQQPGTEFKREQRYYVLKLSDIHGTVSLADLLYLDKIARTVADRRAQEGKEQREYLVLEGDWPEFEPTWRAIEARMSVASTQQQAGGEPQRIFLVPTGEIYEGEETYQRYEGSPPPLCDYEVLYTAQPAPDPKAEPISYTPGTWYEAKDRDDLQAFFLSRLPAIREAAREHGYAIGLHGSMRRDLDLIATPWREGASDKDALAHAIAMAACGITREGPYQWEQKPLGRVAASLSCCWPRWFNEAGAGHIDLSVTAVVEPNAEPVRVPDALIIECAKAASDDASKLDEEHIATFLPTWRKFAEALTAAQAKGGAA